MTPTNKDQKPRKIYSYSGPFKKGIDVANYYGFELLGPIKGIRSLNIDGSTRSKFQQQNYVDPLHKMSVHALHLDKSEGKSSPITFATTYGASKKNGGGINLYVVGSNKGIAEALVIKATTAVLEEYGKKDFIVDINSLGDKNTYKTYMKELSNHYRKHITNIGDCCRTNMKNDLCLLSECDKEACVNVRKEAPRTIGYLTENSRSHLKNVLEYLESVNIPYRINCDLIGDNTNFGTQTVFTISEMKKDKPVVLARGERYTRCDLENQNRKVQPTVCTSIDLPGGKKEDYKVIPENKVKTPSLYLIYLGSEAKRQSLGLIDELRRKNIEIAQSLIYEGLSKQIQHAERLSVPYTIIMGLKEVKEQSVIVRNMDTRAQETVPVGQLPRYIKYIHRL